MSAVKVWGTGSRPLRGTAVHSDGRAWVEVEMKDVGDQALIRGLATAFPIMRLGLFLSYFGRRFLPATNRLTDIPLPWFRLRPWARMLPPLRRRGQAARLRRDGPHEAGQFTGDRGVDHCRTFAARGQLSVAGRQSDLGLPCYLTHTLRCLLQLV